MGQLIPLIVFTMMAVVVPVVVLQLRKIEEILLSAAVISAPWYGGLWISPLLMDLRLPFVFMFIVLLFVLNKNRVFSPKRKSELIVIVSTIFLFLWSLVSASGALNKNLAWGGSASILLNLLLFITIVKSISNINDVEYLLKSLFIGFFITSLFALIQYKSPFFHVEFLFRDFTTFMWWRTRSTFHHANQYGMYQIFILPLVFRQIIIQIQRRKQLYSYALIGLFIVGMFTLYTTRNRGAWLGFVVAMAVTIFLDLFRRGTRKTKKRMIQVILVLSVLISIGGIRYGSRIAERLFGGNYGSGSISDTAESRKEYDDAAYEIFKSKPYTGVGYFNYQYYARVIFSHNMYLLVPSEVGFVGFFFFLIPFVFFLYKSLKCIRYKQYYMLNLGNAFFTAMIAFLVSSYPGPDYWISNQVSCHLWIMAGVIFGLDRFYMNAEEAYKKKKKIMARQQQARKMAAK